MGEKKYKKISFKIISMIIIEILVILFVIFYIITQNNKTNVEFKKLSETYETNIMSSTYEFITTKKELNNWLDENIKESYIDENIVNDMIIEDKSLENYFNDEFFANNNLIILIGDEPISIRRTEDIGILNLPKREGIVKRNSFDFIILDKDIKSIEVKYNRMNNEALWHIYIYISIAITIIIVVSVLKYNKKIGNGILILGILISIYMIVIIIYSLII